MIPSDVNNSKHGNILVVDDTLPNLKLLSTLLNSAGYEVRGASNGRSALMICEKSPPELVLLDIRMPEMDGYEVCRHLKTMEKTRDIPVIFISALNAMDDKVKGFEAGGVDFITKPFQEIEVLARVRSHIQLRRMQLNLEQRTVDLAEAKSVAEEANRVKSAFMASMSHELRTPLNSIIGFTGIILNELTGPLNLEQKKQLKMVKGSSRHLLNLINDVLDISKIEAGELTVSCETFSMRNVVNQVADTLTPLAEKKGLSFSVVIAPEVDMLVSDERRIQQVLINLVNNAIKFTEKGEVKLRCFTHDSSMEVHVTDSGIGIKEGNIEKLFKPFQQLDTGIARIYEGTGLGLSICKRILDILGGTIRVKSQFGKGSTFTFTLPMKPEEKI